jgi:hypothetical protein
METETNDAPAGDLDSILDAAIDKAFEEDENPKEIEASPSGTDSEDVIDSEVSEEQSTEVETQSDELEPLAAPVDLSESAKADFYKLPREGQQLFLTRYKELQADYTRKTQELSSKRRDADQLDQVFSQYEPDLVASGQSKPEVVGNFLRWNSLLNKDPVRGIYKLAEVLGVNLGAPAQRTQEQSSYDPARAELEQRLAAIEARNQEAENGLYQQRLQTQLMGLAEEKDGSGKEVRPLFKELIPNIQGNLAMLAQQPEHEDTPEVELVDLAYRQAYEPYKKLRAESLQKQVQKSKSLSLASSSISSSGSRGVPSRPKIKDVDDAVDRAFEEHGL